MRITPTVHGRGMSSISPQQGLQFNSLDEVPPGLARARGYVAKFPSHRRRASHPARRPALLAQALPRLCLLRHVSAFYTRGVNKIIKTALSAFLVPSASLRRWQADGRLGYTAGV